MFAYTRRGRFDKLGSDLSLAAAVKRPRQRASSSPSPRSLLPELLDDFKGLAQAMGSACYPFVPQLQLLKMLCAGSDPGASCSRSLHVRADRQATLRAACMAEARRTHTPHAQSKFTLRTRCQRTPSQLAPLPVDTAAHTSSRAGRGPAARQTRPASQGRFHPVPLFQSCTLFTSRGRQRRTHGTSPARPRCVSSTAPGAQGRSGHHGDARALVATYQSNAQALQARLHARFARRGCMSATGACT